MKIRTRWKYVEQPPDEPGDQPFRHVVDSEGRLICDADNSEYETNVCVANLKLIAEIPAFLDLLFEVSGGLTASLPPVLFIKIRKLMERVEEIHEEYGADERRRKFEAYETERIIKASGGVLARPGFDEEAPDVRR